MPCRKLVPLLETVPCATLWPRLLNLSLGSSFLLSSLLSTPLLTHHPAAEAPQMMALFCSNESNLSNEEERERERESLETGGNGDTPREEEEGDERLVDLSGEEGRKKIWGTRQNIVNLSLSLCF